MVRAAGVLAVRQPRGRHGGRWDQAAVIKMRELVRLETALEFRQRAKHVKDKPPLRRFVLDSPLEEAGFELVVPSSKRPAVPTSLIWFRVLENDDFEFPVRGGSLCSRSPRASSDFTNEARQKGSLGWKT